MKEVLQSILINKDKDIEDNKSRIIKQFRILLQST